jgi:hypothetical protein
MIFQTKPSFSSRISQPAAMEDRYQARWRKLIQLAAAGRFCPKVVAKVRAERVFY